MPNVLRNTLKAALHLLLTPIHYAVSLALSYQASLQEKSYEIVDHFLKKSANNEKYLLTLLATGINGYLRRKLTYKELIEEAIGYIFAGLGIILLTLIYLLYKLLKPENTAIQERLRAKVLAIPNDNIVAIRNNTYINAVIKKAFYIYLTIILTIPCLLTKPLTLSQYILPSGILHHYDTSIFPEPEKFIPKRWLNETSEIKSTLTPFSISKRNYITGALLGYKGNKGLEDRDRGSVQYRSAGEKAHAHYFASRLGECYIWEIR
ncbi:unnamed protein product [Fusarium fujikuroi]|nr:unnamed protein product [Fusarium fujikuroi]